MKKFEEGIFSDLRNLKPGVDASLEEPKVSRSSFWDGGWGGDKGRDKFDSI